MVRKIAKVDANQPAFVYAVRSIGGEVLDIHQLGDGVPDLLTVLRKRLLLVELKRSRKASLTDDETKFARLWPGEVCRANCIEDWLRANGIAEGSMPWVMATARYVEVLQDIDRKTGDTLYSEYLDTIKNA